jgi:hypothetical protein
MCRRKVKNVASSPFRRDLLLVLRLQNEVTQTIELELRRKMEKLPTVATTVLEF